MCYINTLKYVHKMYLNILCGLKHSESEHFHFLHLENLLPRKVPFLLKQNSVCYPQYEITSFRFTYCIPAQQPNGQRCPFL